MICPIVATEEPSPNITITLPEARDTALDQNEEYCDVEIDGVRRRIRFHDYAQIYQIPGLYEKLFAELLNCVSPTVIAELLAGEVSKAGQDMQSLRVLDFGAGNGMVAEALAATGVNTIFGIDLLPDARVAALRDRPGLYSDYIANDVTALDPEQHRELDAAQLNCLTCVAALGFDDVPPVAFAAAFNFLESPAWCAFNLRDRFVDEPGAFSRLLDRMTAEGVLRETAHVRYRHRMSVAGEPIQYDAIVARKTGDIPQSWLE